MHRVTIAIATAALIAALAAAAPALAERKDPGQRAAERADRQVHLDTSVMSLFGVTQQRLDRYYVDKAAQQAAHDACGC